MTITPRTQKATPVRHTKASMLGRQSTPSQQPHRPRRSLVNPLHRQEQPNNTKKRRSLITTREFLRQRPAWDMRGKISDLEAQLEKNNHQLEHLHRFKDELTTLNDDRDSEQKQTLQRIMALKSELQTLDRKHAQEMENRSARQRIHYQELKDQQLINKRQEGTMGIMLEDARRKLKQARTKLDQVTQERQQWEAKSSQVTTETHRLEQELKHVVLKLERFDGNLADRERAIHDLNHKLNKERPGLEAAELKLQKAVATNLRLKSMVDEIQRG